ncbi:MAG: hypothetical protein GY950_01645, partial [bacterium]|nr:hypothetical protein [bacterium]
MNNADKYNLHGHMIEYNKNKRTWTWSKWDYQQSGGKKQVVRRSGTLQFQKIFRSVVQGGEERVNARNSEDLEKSLEKKGVDFIFLYQGATKVDDRFQTIEEAEKHFRLDSCPHWDLTD